MSARARIVLLGAASALVLALALALLLARPASRTSSTGAATAGSGEPSSSGFAGAAIPGAPRAGDFILSDQYGHKVSLSQYRGQVTILSFLYSTCGPPCILIAQQIRGALDELPHPVPVLIVSAMPTADTPQTVARFLAQTSLTGRVHYLSGPLRALEPIWRAYGVVPGSSGAAAFARSASVLLLDRSGRERVLFQQEQLTPEALAHDIRKLS